MGRHEQKECLLRGSHEKFGIAGAKRGVNARRKTLSRWYSDGDEFLGYFKPGIRFLSSRKIHSEGWIYRERWGVGGPQGK